MLVFLALLIQIIFTAGMAPSPQPCMICGGAVARIWSMHSHVGDRYLRIDITAFYNVSNHTAVKVDFGGDLDNHFTTALVQFKDVSSGFPDFETRIIITFLDSINGTRYHLQAVGENEELRAIPESVAATLTDKSDVFAPERLKYEHHLFFVFESVKYREYYLGSKGNAVSKLVNIHSEAYRDSETLFKLIDPGNTIAGASFGSVTAKRKRRAVIRSEKNLNVMEINELFPGKAYQKKPPTMFLKEKTRLSSIRSSVKIPVLDTFTLCFWLKTKDDFAQIFGILYKKNKIPRIEVLINKGYLTLMLNGRSKRVRRCQISDGKWHHVCVSVKNTSRMFVYKDGVGIHQTSFRFPKGLQNKPKESATVFLGRRSGSKRSFGLHGDLTQVNIWDDYPLFRIRRIATNSACGGGNIVQWKDFLKNTSTKDVLLYNCEDCPQRVGYNFDKKTQNNLV